METWISPQVAAKRLGISSSTFKRFCDTHNVPLVRTPGGHRRIDACQFEVISRLLRTLTELDDAELTVSDTVTMLLEGAHIELADRFWNAAHSPAPLAKLLEDVLVPALWKVGDLWQKNQIDTAHEKVCTTTAGLVVDSLIGRIPALPHESRTFVGASFTGNLDTLASKFIAFSLRSVNVRGIPLGCSISPEVIAKAAELYDAEVVWITHTHITNSEQVVADHELLQKLLPADTRVVIGGGGLAPSIRRMIRNCTYYESIENWLQAEKAIADQPVSDSKHPKQS